MNGRSYHFLKLSGLFSALYIFFFFFNVNAQKPLSNTLQALLPHGVEQYEQGHYTLAAATLTEYLKAPLSLTENTDQKVLSSKRDKARFYLVLSSIKSGKKDAEKTAALFIHQSADPVYRQRAAFTLAHDYFLENKLKEAITYYEIAGIANLSNEEIADAKFELAYCYFNNQQFDKALPLFAAIKELPDNKYYVPGNYYYGLLAYNNKDYKNALKSFNRIHNLESYKDVVPYYEAEINYFMGDQEKVLALSRKYLGRKGDLFYEKDMRLLTAQTLFEQKEYKKALPYFEYYYGHSDKIRKEELYELAYTYYRLEDWQNAIEKFQPLSNARDSLGQTSMYLLGDCYLKVKDKTGARNAFGICANMDFNQSQKEAASFLYAKLSYELGDEAIASRKLYAFLKEYPRSEFANEAKTLLTGLLAKNNNYREAFAIMNDMARKDEATWAIYQKVAVGRAMQLMQNKEWQAADSIFNLSLQQPLNTDYEAIAYFWKGEIAFHENNYDQAVQYSRTFLDKVQNREYSVREISSNATVQNANLNIGYAELKKEQFNDAQKAFANAQQGNSVGYSDMLSSNATLREADALFMQKDFDQAAQLYDKAIAQGIADPDYARLQKSLIYGFQGDTKSKRAILNGIIQKQPASEYKGKAQYELAASYLESNEFGDALPLLEALSENEQLPEGLRSKALMSLAYTYQQNGDADKSMEIYKKYIAEYPSSPYRQDALDAIRSLYIKEGAPEKYAGFLKDNNLPAADDTTIEKTYYDAATLEYGNHNLEKAIAAFSKYLDHFPNGTFATKAHFYRGESYYQLKDPAHALSDYEAVEAAGWSDYAEDASLKAATIYFTEKDYKNALQNYGALREVAVRKENLQTAYEGLMKSSFELGDYNDVAAFADTLLSMPDLNKVAAAGARLYKAKAFQNENDFPQALSLYETLDKENLGAASAEARYRIAEILLAQDKLKEAEKQASISAQNSGGQEYWVINSYILLGDILMQEKDYFNAKATLQSVVEHAGDKMLKEKAKQKLEAVKALEKAQSKLSD
jgi:TolA-binding protein